MPLIKYSFLFVFIADFKEDFYVYILKTNDTGYMTPLYQDHIGLYDYNLLMNWKIVVDINQIILLNILYMDIEPNDLICHKDFLKVSSF